MYENGMCTHFRDQLSERYITNRYAAYDKSLQVNAFRSMMHNDMMVGAFSHSTAVGKLRQQLPDVPVDARVNLRRYTLEEAEAVSYYYLR